MTQKANESSDGQIRWSDNWNADNWNVAWSRLVANDSLDKDLTLHPPDRFYAIVAQKVNEPQIHF